MARSGKIDNNFQVDVGAIVPWSKFWGSERTMVEVSCYIIFQERERGILLGVQHGWNGMRRERRKYSQGSRGQLLARGLQVSCHLRPWRPTLLHGGRTQPARRIFGGSHRSQKEQD